MHVGATSYQDDITEPSIDPIFSNDVHLDITSKIFETYLYPEVLNLLKCENEYGTVCARTSVLKEYTYNLQRAHHNFIHTKPQLDQELFLLHQTCKVFYYYNDFYFNLSHQAFRAKILYPNIIYMLVRLFSKANTFLRKNIKNVFEEIRRRSKGIIQRYSNAYYTDEELIKTDILYEFLGNGLKKFNPLEAKNINFFYRGLFRSIFNFYLKGEEQVHATFMSVWDVDTYIGQMMGSPTRLSIYRDVLYALQIDRFCKQSPTLAQLNYNYGVFRNVIVGNEFQNIYFSCKTDTIMLDDNHYKLMRVYNEVSKDNGHDRIIDEIKKLPMIYKLFTSVHIINPKIRPYNDSVIKRQVVKSAVLEELIHPFRNMFNESHIYPMLEKISENFVNNILTGEYVNLLTLSNVYIGQISFIFQLRQFVKLCIYDALQLDRNS